jgi:hypothetical protein
VVLAVYGADRAPMLDWIIEEQLADITASEFDLLTVDNLPDEQRCRSAIEIEADLPAIVSLMPPGGNRTAEEIRASTLRPAEEIAALAEQQTELKRAAMDHQSRSYRLELSGDRALASAIGNLLLKSGQPRRQETR